MIGSSVEARLSSRRSFSAGVALFELVLILSRAGAGASGSSSDRRPAPRRRLIAPDHFVAHLDGDASAEQQRMRQFECVTNTVRRDCRAAPPAGTPRGYLRRCEPYPAFRPWRSTSPTASRAGDAVRLNPRLRPLWASRWNGLKPGWYANCRRSGRCVMELIARQSPLVSGSSRGIGLATAKAFAAEGCG